MKGVSGVPGPAADADPAPATSIAAAITIATNPARIRDRALFTVSTFLLINGCMKPTYLTDVRYVNAFHLVAPNRELIVSKECSHMA